MKRSEISRSNWGKIVNQGMGNFLCPPKHPEHNYSVGSVYGDTFCMSLSSAAESDWLDDDCRGLARARLKAWNPLPITEPSVQDWIHQVLGYFRNCYRGRNKKGEISYSGEAIQIIKDVDPVALADVHAGVHLIRKYYPDYMPTDEDFQLAYWGIKQHNEAQQGV